MNGAELLGHAVGIGGAVWRASWQASVLALLVVAVQLMVGKRLSARWRHAMWLLVLVRLALPVVPSSPMSVFNLAPKANKIRSTIASAHPVEIVHAPLSAGARIVPPAIPQLPTRRPAKPQAAISAAPAFAPDLWAGWPQVLASLWVSGASLLALRIAWATRRVSRMLRRLDPVDDDAILDILRASSAELHVGRLPKLLVGDGLFSPALVGFIRPRLLVPRDLLVRFDARELRLIFLHELAHLKRRDIAINWAATLIAIVHWMNPIVWLVTWRLRQERELACDELVLSRTNDDDRRAYGHTIVKLLENFSHHAAPLPGGVGILEGKAQMKRRITMIANFAKSGRAWTVVAAFLVLALGLVALTDAVQAEDPAPTTRPARQGTITMADGKVVTTNGPDNLKQGTITLENGKVVTTNDYDVLNTAAVTVEPATAQPPAAGARVSVSSDDIAWTEQALNALQVQRENVPSTLGEGHPRVAELDSKIAEHRASLQALRKEYARAARQPTTLKVNDLVAVSIMDLVGPGVESTRTARIDGDGTISLPYIGAVKAEGLTRAELENAIAGEFKKASVVEHAVIAVSFPERGESHQLASRREQPAVAIGSAAVQTPIKVQDGGTLLLGYPQAEKDNEQLNAALEKKLPEIKFDNVSLADAIEFLREQTEAAIVVNWRSVEAAGIDRAAPVTLNVRDAAFKDALALVLRQPDDRLISKIENGAIVIDASGEAPPAKLVTKAYDVADLLAGVVQDNRSGRTALDELTGTIMAAVSPESWNLQHRGGQAGEGSLTAYGTKLVVKAREDVHRDLVELLTMLRETPATQPATRLGKLLLELQQ